MAFADIPSPLKSELAATVTDAGRGFQQLLGPGVPQDLLRHQPRSGGFLLSDPAELLGDENTFLAAMKRSDPDHVEPLLQVFTSTWYLKHVPQDGDAFMAHTPADGDCAHVVIWSHEERFFNGPVAWDIPTALRIANAYAGQGELTPSEVEPVLGRYDNLSWPFRNMEEQLIESGLLQEAGPKATPEPSHFNRLQGRSFWLAEVLSGRAVYAEALQPQRSWTPDAVLKKNVITKYPPTALYWMWRSFFFAEPWLATVLEQAQKSESRLVQDAAKIIMAIEKDEAAGKDVVALDLIFIRSKVQEQLALATTTKP